MIPSNLYEYLINRLDQLTAPARLVLVLDPGGKLALSDEVVSSQGNVIAPTWKVLRYDGNDLAFRRYFDPFHATLVWATGPKISSPPINIDITSLADIVRRADDILDLSLLGCLQTLIPSETWPAEPIEQYADLIGSHLGIFIKSYKKLKPYLDRNAALGLHSIKALILSCLQPSLQPVDFLFRVDSAVELLKKYITLAWTLDWDEVGLQMLQEQAHGASLLPLKVLAPWFEVDTHGLAQLVYFYRLLSLARVPNIINQIRGLGLLPFDPESLEAGLGQVIVLWEKDLSWRNRVIQNAETELEMETIQRATSLLSQSTAEILKNLVISEMPALMYSLIVRIVDAYMKDGRINDLLDAWVEIRPRLQIQFKDLSTKFSQPLNALVNVLDEASAIYTRVNQENVTSSTLGDMMKWYVQGHYYDLEYAHARAVMSSAKIKEASLQQQVQLILSKLRERLRIYLDQADHVLARQIQTSWHAYSTSTELSSNILRDFVMRVKLIPTEAACLWLLIFDGMRFDTWESIIKPRLQQVFEIKKEKNYFCPLPSWTSIARTSITAGNTPDLWKSYHNTFTYNQSLLAGKFFGLPESQYLQRIRFASGMESDRTIDRLDRYRRYPYNILIFNISDDDLHKQRDHIGALNENIKAATDRILDFLDGLIIKEDTVIITSDHGFMELDPGYEIVVDDSNKWQRYMEGGEHPVRFRFIRSDDPVEDLPLEHTLAFDWKMPEGRFTVAIGRHWFQRKGSKNTIRYDHGGLSFAEMVVPGVVMQPIREKKIDLRIEGLPDELLVNEGEPITLEVNIGNRGNQPAAFDLVYFLDTDSSQRKISAQISPYGKSDLAITLNPVFLSEERKTKLLTLILTYDDYKGLPKTPRKDIPVKIVERKDLVTISLGGLDDLDL